MEILLILIAVVVVASYYGKVQDALTPKKRVRSMTDSTKSYETSLTARTCTCPDFCKRRAAYPQNDCRRLCKHLLSRIAHEGYPSELQGYAPLLDYYIHKRLGAPLYSHYQLVIIGDTTYHVTQNDASPWYNVHKGQQWGYHPIKKRWAYNESPSHAADIACLLSNITMLPAGSIETISIQATKEANHWKATGMVEGVSIKATINTRAQWQEVNIGGECLSYHMETQSGLGTSKYPHMVKAVQAWFSDVFLQVKALQHEQKEQQKAALISKNNVAAFATPKPSSTAKTTPFAIVTTEEEKKAHALIQTLLSDIVPKERISMRDAKSYCTILLDAKVLCRLYLTENKKYIGITGEDKKERKYPLSNVDALHSMKGELYRAVTRVLAG